MLTNIQSVRASITAALMRGAKFIVHKNERIEVLIPDRIPEHDKARLRENWPAAKAEILGIYRQAEAISLIAGRATCFGSPSRWQIRSCTSTIGSGRWDSHE